MPACKSPKPGALKDTCMKAYSELCTSGGDCTIDTGSHSPDFVTSLRQCEQSAQAASAACPSLPLIPPAPEKGDAGLKESCEQYNASVQKAKSGNLNYSGGCRKAIAMCRATCMDAKFAVGGGGVGSGVGAGVPMPAARPPATPIAADATGQFDKIIGQCDGFEFSNAAPVEAQMDGLAKNSIVALDCAKLAGGDGPPGGKDGPGGGKDSPGGGGKTDATNPSKNASNTGMGGMNPQSLMQLAQALMKQDDKNNEEEPQQPQMQDCSSNPNLAGCTTQTASVQSWNQPAGESGVAKDSDSGGGTPNPTDISGAQVASLNQPGQFGTPSTTQGVPNGGGQMLGGGGGGGAASLGGGGGGGAGGAGGKKVEITTGGGGGGFSQQAANMKMTNGEGGGGYSYGGRGLASSGDGFNLSEFLPGGAKDPFKGRGLAGSTTGTGNFQIQSKDVNLFSRISERIKSRCAQGLLRDCIP